MSSKFDTLTQEITARAEKLDYVIAFWVHGSYATGRAHEQSDINYAFLVKESRDYDRLKREFSDVISWRSIQGPYPEQQWEVAVWKKEKWTFKDIGWDVLTPEDLETYEGLFSDKFMQYKGERWAKHWQETHLVRHQGEARRLFEGADIKYDPEGVISGVVKILENYPEAVKRGVKNWALGKLRKRLPWHLNPWIMRDKFRFFEEITEDLHYIAIAHYALNGKFPMSDLNHYEEDLKTLEPNIEKQMHALIAHDKEDKYAILVEIIGQLDKDTVF